nr:ISAs1 family transposase [Gloeobacter morelensis]
MRQFAIFKAFENIPDPRRGAGRRHPLPLCLTIFTMAVVAGNRGFLAIDDWVKANSEALIELFEIEKERLPSYSTLRRVLMHIDYQQYATSLATFLQVEPLPGETIALDGKVLKGSYCVQHNNPTSEPHAAIQIIHAYLVEHGWVVGHQQVDQKSNEIKALPELIEQLALAGVVFTFDAINTQKKLRNHRGKRQSLHRRCQRQSAKTAGKSQGEFRN